MKSTLSSFENNYRTDWLVDLNRILLFQIMDQMFFPETLNGIEGGDDTEKSPLPASLKGDLTEGDLEIFSNEMISRTPFFQNFCRCTSCLLDVAAIALNHQKPLYRISPEYNPFSTIEESHRIELKKGVFRAMMVVKDHPHH